jgi:hypothetical protein
MKNIIDILNEVTEFIVGSEGEPVKEEVTQMGFEPVRKKRKYTKRKKPNANKKQN